MKIKLTPDIKIVCQAHAVNSLETKETSATELILLKSNLA